ncbi:MAG TPA: enoyl-CoA hydratase/isomerase family protein [candidate division Zixibacteria bacterium]|nr:enoyl-CoA hydratase/isomerase family protein [candidate division Zixibacteria bacterium]
MTDSQLVLQRLDETSGVAWLTLNRPEKKNALSIALLSELGAALRDLRENPAIRCIVTTGAGDCYSSGRDLYDMRNQDNRRRSRGVGGVAEIVALMRSCPQITIAAVRGWCLGGGLALVNGHDLVVSAETAKYGMPEIIRGSYGATATPTLFHAGIPLKKAFYISLTGRNLSAGEAERIGLVSQVVPDGELTASVETLAREIASRNAAALEHAKIAAYMMKDMNFETALRTDDLVAHRLRYYTNPLSDVEGYLQSQKGGGNARYVKPEKK